MNWRDLSIGAFVTLLVTVIAGVIVYYVTREEKPKAPREELVYRQHAPIKLETEKTKLTIQNIDVQNIGDAPATAVRTHISARQSGVIIDKAVTLSSGKAGTYEVRKLTDSELEVFVPTLLAQERITLSIVFDRALNPSIEISARSDKSIARTEFFSKGSLRDPLSTLDIRTLKFPVYPSSLGAKTIAQDVAGVLIPFAVIMQLLLLIFARQRLDVMRPNNTAFLLIHNGRHHDAKRLLQRAINEKGGDSYVLGNYALCLSLDNDNMAPESYLAAAEYFAWSRRQRAFVAFNRGICQIRAGMRDEGLDSLRKAVGVYSGIKEHLSTSRVVADLGLAQHRVKEALAELIAKK